MQGGCEAILHAVRKAVDDDPNLWVLQVDQVNAFNLADRGTALQEVEQIFPEALAWTSTCYSTPSYLLFGDTVINSESGFQQGDPIAALLFALVQ